MPSFPMTPEYATLDDETDVSSVFSKSINNVYQERLLGGHSLVLTLNYPPLKPANLRILHSFVKQRHADKATFTIVPTQFSYLYSDCSGTLSVNAPAAVGALSVSVEGISGTLKDGEYFTFSNQEKVYMSTVDVTGSGQLSFIPGLRVAVTSLHTINYQNIAVKMRMDPNQSAPRRNKRPGNIHTLTAIKLVEAVQ